MTGHDPDLDLVGRDRAGAVGTEQDRLPALHPRARADHVAHRDAFGDADHELEPGIHRFIDRGGGIRRGHVDHRHRGAGRRLGVVHRVVDRDALEVLAALARRDARHVAILPVGIVAAHARVELAGLAGDALRDDLGVLVDEDGHGDWAPAYAGVTTLVPSAAATTFCAASPMSLAEMIGRPESARIFLPRSTLVPSRRTTSATLRPTCLAAATTPSAITSQRMMPPKMLTRIAASFGLRSMILKASVTFSVVAPPPTSRKLAGLPP